MGERAVSAQLAVRTTDPDRHRLLGLAPYFDSPLDAAELSKMASEVMAARSGGVERDATTETQKVWWGLGVFITMLSARVWMDVAVLGRLVRGEWVKYELGGLSLRDFHRGGHFAVGADVLVDYDFLLTMMDALRGLATVLSAVFSPGLVGCVVDVLKRMEDAQYDLASCTQMRLFTQLNDAIADGIDDAKRSAKGPTGGDLKTAADVKAVFEYYLALVPFAGLKDGAAVNTIFNKHRRHLYSWGKPEVVKDSKALPAPVKGVGGGKEGQTGGGVGKQKEEKAGGKGTLCVDFLREALGLRKRVSVPRAGHARTSRNNAAPLSPVGDLVRCSNARCGKEHVVLAQETKAGLLKRLEAEEVDVNMGYGADIKAALERCGELRK
jgi:hypothetical protein